ncbi:uncharacterized protein At4g22160-like protein [Anopheles sinensis]|uniref:Uncharacterized protein At4g22160-like protein n=1 Tax=Anopheles sinensis TaxID=74873 RepID=A0A084VEL9_ANOSI|nr:uncharacterized protein At4g22160-like protein [Anopheles sinensis]
MIGYDSEFVPFDSCPEAFRFEVLQNELPYWREIFSAERRASNQEKRQTETMLRRQGSESSAFENQPHRHQKRQDDRREDFLRASAGFWLTWCNGTDSTELARKEFVPRTTKDEDHSPSGTKDETNTLCIRHASRRKKPYGRPIVNMTLMSRTTRKRIKGMTTNRKDLSCDSPRPDSSF